MTASLPRTQRKQRAQRTAATFARALVSVSFVTFVSFVLPLALGAIWLGCFVWQLRGRAILPVHDPEFDEALGRIIERGAPPRTAH